MRKKCGLENALEVDLPIGGQDERQEPSMMIFMKDHLILCSHFGWS